MRDTVKISKEINSLILEVENGGGKHDLLIQSTIDVWMKQQHELSTWQEYMHLATKLWQYRHFECAQTVYDTVINNDQLSGLQAQAFLGKGIIASLCSDYEGAASQMETAAMFAKKHEDKDCLLLIRRNQLSLLYDRQKWTEYIQKAREWAFTDGVIYVSFMVEAAERIGHIGRYDDAIAILIKGEALLSRDAPIALRLKWLNGLIMNIRNTSDFRSLYYCSQMLQSTQDIDYLKKNLNSKSASEVSLVYDLLSDINLELAEEQVELTTVAVYQKELKKEIDFFSHLTSIYLPTKEKALEKEIIQNIAATESAIENSFRNKLGSVSGLTNKRNTLESGRDLKRNLLEQLESIYLNNSPLNEVGEIPDNFFSIGEFTKYWPFGCLGLVYWLDRKESVIQVFLIHPDCKIDKFKYDVNCASFLSILEICKRGIEHEVEFMAGYLTGVLFPVEVRDALYAAGADTLLLAPDPALNDVPWEAIGEGGNYLGTDFNLLITPSLVHTLSQLSREATLYCRPAVFDIISNPTQDLPHSVVEANEIANLLLSNGRAVNILSSCRHEDFIKKAGQSEWLHYAGHANYLHSYPLSSYLQLADYLLTVQEIGGIKICQNSVWILNACEAARSGNDSLGHSFGFARMLLFKKAAAVIAANWPTADEIGARTLIQFYNIILIGNYTLCEAMKKVRKSMMEEGFSMYEWAQYSYFGHPYANFGLLT